MLKPSKNIQNSKKPKQMYNPNNQPRQIGESGFSILIKIWIIAQKPKLANIVANKGIIELESPL